MTGIAIYLEGGGDGNKTRRGLRRGVEPAVAEGVPQTAGYMDRCGAESGHLVVFDLDGGRSWEEKIYRRAEEHEGRTITVWGM